MKLTEDQKTRLVQAVDSAISADHGSTVAAVAFSPVLEAAAAKLEDWNALASEFKDQYSIRRQAFFKARNGGESVPGLDDDALRKAWQRMVERVNEYRADIGSTIIKKPESANPESVKKAEQRKGKKAQASANAAKSKPELLAERASLAKSPEGKTADGVRKLAALDKAINAHELAEAKAREAAAKTSEAIAKAAKLEKVPTGLSEAVQCIKTGADAALVLWVFQNRKQVEELRAAIIKDAKATAKDIKALGGFPELKAMPAPAAH